MLRAAASSLNQFEGDGSFLENFQSSSRPEGDGSASDSGADRSSTIRALTTCDGAVSLSKGCWA